MPTQLKKGTVIIPLIIILLLSFGTLALVKFLTVSQADVETAIDSRYDNYSLSLSSKLDPADNWVFYLDTTHKYKLYYPKQWVGNRSSEKGTDFLQTYERFLSTKVNLKVTITKAFNIPADSKRIMFGNNEFNFYKDEEDAKSAVANVNNLFYNIELKQNNYFATPLEFRAFFFQVLKKFEFSN